MVISSHGLFDLDFSKLLFRPLDISLKSLRPFDLSYQCYLDHWTFRAIGISIYWLFDIKQLYRPLEISYSCRSNYKFRSFWPSYFPMFLSDISPSHFDLAHFEQKEKKKCHFDLRHSNSRSFRLTHFSVLSHSDLRNFRSYAISTLEHFTKGNFDLWTFRINVISNFGLFGFKSFRSYVISTFEHFTISHLINISNLWHLNYRNVRFK